MEVQLINQTAYVYIDPEDVGTVTPGYVTRTPGVNTVLVFRRPTMEKLLHVTRLDQPEYRMVYEFHNVGVQHNAQLAFVWVEVPLGTVSFVEPL